MRMTAANNEAFSTSVTGLDAEKMLLILRRMDLMIKVLSPSLLIPSIIDSRQRAKPNQNKGGSIWRRPN